MAKLYATLETSKGKIASLSDNDDIVVSLLYKGTAICKIYMSYNDGDVIIDYVKSGNDEMRIGEWRNRPKTNDKVDDWIHSIDNT